MPRLPLVLLLATLASHNPAASQESPSNEMRCTENHTNKHLCRIQATPGGMLATIAAGWTVTPDTLAQLYPDPAASQAQSSLRRWAMCNTVSYGTDPVTQKPTERTLRGVVSARYWFVSTFGDGFPAADTISCSSGEPPEPGEVRVAEYQSVTFPMGSLGCHLQPNAFLEVQCGIARDMRCTCQGNHAHWRCIPRDTGGNDFL